MYDGIIKKKVTYICIHFTTFKNFYKTVKTCNITFVILFFYFWMLYKYFVVITGRKKEKIA